MKRMLINATQPEELRVALVDGQHLYNLDIETPAREQKKANIYKGRITRVEPSLEAAFIDYGAERHGFLPLKEVSPTLFQNKPDDGQRTEIKQVLKEGQEIVVQVVKEERGNKGAALTTFISMAGRYLVLMPNNPRAGGISRRIEGDERNELRDAINALTIPDGMGLIIRTAGLGKGVEELQWDLDYLANMWAAIEQASSERKAPFLIYQESDIIIRAIRDHLRPDIGEILIDDPSVFDRASDFMQQVMPHNISRLKRYEDDIPLFTRYQIENQIEAAFQHEIRLPSGGSIVIDHTEALVSIDINSSRATKGSDIEETALNTNLEAADEIARQMRLRDIGGLIVIDFIDMNPVRNQRQVENRLKDALKNDRARIQVGRISRFGLLEMSRQRLRPSLGESSQDTCPRCNGMGVIRGVESLALSILRVIEEDAMKENTAQIIIQLPVNVATYLLNEKRDVVSDIERRQNIRILLIANSTLETPNYDMQRQRKEEIRDNGQSSYQLTTDFDKPAETGQPSSEKRVFVEQPAVKGVSPTKPAPGPGSNAKQQATEKEEGGFIKQLWSNLFGNEKTEETPAVDTTNSTERSTQNRNKSSDERSGQSSGRGRGGRSRRSNSSRNQNQNKNDKKAEATVVQDAEPKKDSATQNQNTTPTATTETDGETSTRSRSSRGRRGGRGRGRGRRRNQNADGNETNESNGNQSSVAQPAASNDNASGNTSDPQSNSGQSSNATQSTAVQSNSNQSNPAQGDSAQSNSAQSSATQSKQTQNSPAQSSPAQSRPTQSNTNANAAPSRPAQQPTAGTPDPTKPTSPVTKSDNRPSPSPASGQGSTYISGSNNTAEANNGNRSSTSEAATPKAAQSAVITQAAPVITQTVNTAPAAPPKHSSIKDGVHAATTAPPVPAAAKTTTEAASSINLSATDKHNAE